MGRRPSGHRARSGGDRRPRLGRSSRDVRPGGGRVGSRWPLRRRCAAHGLALGEIGPRPPHVASGNGASTCAAGAASCGAARPWTLPEVAHWRPPRAVTPTVTLARCGRNRRRCSSRLGRRASARAGAQQPQRVKGPPQAFVVIATIRTLHPHPHTRPPRTFADALDIARTSTGPRANGASRNHAIFGGCPRVGRPDLARMRPHPGPIPPMSRKSASSPISGRCRPNAEDCPNVVVPNSAESGHWLEICRIRPGFSRIWLRSANLAESGPNSADIG